MNAINKAKREKEAAQRKAGMERSQEAAEERKEQLEIIYKQKTMTEYLTNRMAGTNRVTYTATPEAMSSAITAYEQSIMEASGILK